jgi:hypothetical protein
VVDRKGIQWSAAVICDVTREHAAAQLLRLLQTSRIPGTRMLAGVPQRAPKFFALGTNILEGSPTSHFGICFKCRLLMGRRSS